jgi:uncharacterized membrane protein
LPSRFAFSNTTRNVGNAKVQDPGHRIFQQASRRQPITPDESAPAAGARRRLPRAPLYRARRRRRAISTKAIPTAKSTTLDGSGSGVSTACDGALAGVQVWPPSMLSSVKMSKKLLIMNPPPGLGVNVVVPVDGIVGLSRTSTPGGSEPPDISSCNNCVWTVSMPVPGSTLGGFTRISAVSGATLGTLGGKGATRRLHRQSHMARSAAHYPA